MLDLLIGVFLSTLTGVFYKKAIHSGCRHLAIISAERAVVVLGVLGLSLFCDGFAFDPALLSISVLAGTAVVVSRICLMRSLAIGDLGLSWTIWNLSVSVPVLAAMFLWWDLPSAAQAAGLLLVPAGILLAGNPYREADPDSVARPKRRFGWTYSRQQRSWLCLMVLAFLCEGVFATSFLILKNWELSDSRFTYMILYNSIALMLTTGVMAAKGYVPTGREWGAGTAAGLCVISSAYFWLRALFDVQSVIFFPICASVAIVFMNVLARVTWHEKTTWTQNVGVVAAILAILLLTSH